MAKQKFFFLFSLVFSQSLLSLDLIEDFLVNWDQREDKQVRYRTVLFASLYILFCHALFVNIYIEVCIQI